MKWAIKAMKTHRENLNAHYQVKAGKLKKLYTVWLQLYDFLQKEKLWKKRKNYGDNKKINGFQSWSRGRD